MNCLILAFALFTTEPSYGEIRDQIDLLGSDFFDERQAATHKLKEMGFPAIKVLVKFDTTDREIIDRRGYILSYFIQNFKIQGRELPWIDCLPEDYPNREKIVKSCMIYKHWYLDIPNFKSITDVIDAEANRSIKGQGDFKGYRFGTMLFILDLIKEGKKEKEIRELLVQMIEIENIWKAKGGRYLQFSPFRSNPPAETTPAEGFEFDPK